MLPAGQGPRPIGESEVAERAPTVPVPVFVPGKREAAERDVVGRGGAGVTRGREKGGGVRLCGGVGG